MVIIYSIYVLSGGGGSIVQQYHVLAAIHLDCMLAQKRLNMQEIIK